MFSCVRVRCCRSVLTSWSKLWIRSWCQTSGWVNFFYLTVCSKVMLIGTAPLTLLYSSFPSRGSAQPMNEPRSSLLPESSPLAGSGPMTPRRRNWTRTQSTLLPRGLAEPSSTAWRMRCLVKETQQSFGWYVHWVQAATAKCSHKCLRRLQRTLKCCFK